HDNSNNLHNYNDISDFILKNDGCISESKKEESGMEERSVTLAQDYIGRNYKKLIQEQLNQQRYGITTN
ncbi:1150_t:CDS:2, partial [Entrophospora sp. SA101]